MLLICFGLLATTQAQDSHFRAAMKRAQARRSNAMPAHNLVQIGTNDYVSSQSLNSMMAKNLASQRKGQPPSGYSSGYGSTPSYNSGYNGSTGYNTGYGSSNSYGNGYNSASQYGQGPAGYGNYGGSTGYGNNNYGGSTPYGG